MPLPSCQQTVTKPSDLLSLVAASIVASHQPSWLARPVKELASEVGVRADRVSRLKGKLLVPFRRLLDRCLRRGRPPKEPPSGDSSRLKVLEELLAVAADILQTLGVARRDLQDRLVAARDRLAREHGLSHSSFCRLLGLSGRTVRYWARRGVAPRKKAKGTCRKPPPRPRGEGRFALEVTLPGLQAMPDTSNWELFGVPLKVVAIQDPGDRHRELWKGFQIDDHEDHELVVQVVKEALEEQPGTQLLTDQGTPYLAEAARDAYDELALEHHPQKEGTPTERATLERSFRTVKDALAPLERLSRRLAEAMPALGSKTLAISVGRLLVAVFLRVYLAARQGVEVERPQDLQVLEALAEQQREKACAEDRSAKLALRRIHRAYRLGGSERGFVGAHSRYRVEDILEAERRMGWRACRCHAGHCDRYYAAILRNVAIESQQRRKRERRELLERKELEEKYRRARQLRKELENDPERWVAHALVFLGAQYHARKDELRFQGSGIGRAQLENALEHLAKESALSVRDRAEVGWQQWLREKKPTPPCAERVRELFERLLGEVLGTRRPSTSMLTTAILRGCPLNPNRRPSPGSRLRNYPARSG